MVLVAELFEKKKMETLSEFDSTIDKLYVVYKSMWKKFDDFVDQNGAPGNNDQQSTLITTVEQMSGSVLKKIDDVEKCKRETHVKMKTRPRLSIINDIYLKIDDELKRDCERVHQLRQAEQDKLGYILRKIARQLQPTSSQRKFDYNELTHLHTVRTSRNCYSVSFKGDGRLIAACDFGFHLCDEHGNRECGRSAKFPTTAIEINEEIYYIDLWNWSYIKKCSLDLDNEVTISSFNYPSHTHSRLAVSNNYLAVNEKLHKSILVHRISPGSNKRTKDLGYEPVHIFFHQDGNLLVTDEQNGVLLSYRVAEDCGIAEEWRCTGLELASSICTDGLGNIFVGSTDKKVLYIVSKEGKLISELSHEELPKSPGGMSIQDNTLAIACIADGYKFFMFN
ncbi:hypothetical protein EB796_022323 [Bugula neritina]|uniref:Uncharacterized protein n=1 Tax=Bugula neritina TaxID=10212 RepID=A0A7J7J0V6_BUGNE|nr:hypothetical protein EB796_022323 [Bugula neritina]